MFLKTCKCFSNYFSEIKWITVLTGIIESFGRLAGFSAEVLKVINNIHNILG